MNILLICSAGVTTTVMADKMMKVVQEKGKDCKVWAVEENEVVQELERNPADIVLVGPQIKFKLKAIQKRCEKFQIPVLCIDPRDFGMGNAENVIKFAEKELGEN